MYRSWAQYALLLVLCLTTRSLTSIYYIEDVDSLRFAFAATDFSVADFRPHFPGYPVYCFLLQGVYLLTASVGLSFALLGGLSTFLLITAADRIWGLWSQRPSYLLSGLLFLNPLLWLMSTRYMPDIMGLALLLWACYWMLSAFATRQLLPALLFCGAVGLLAGVRLSYLPFFLPALALVPLFLRQLHFLAGVILLAVAVWLIPLILDTGFEALLRAGQNQTTGHFYEWGGAVTSESATYRYRLMRTLESLWADGMGAWWTNRHWLTGLLAGVWLLAMGSGLRQLWTTKKWQDRRVQLLLIGTGSYLIWAFFFQNIIYKPRHIMPLLPFLVLLCTLGFFHFQQWNTKAALGLMVVGVALNLLVTGILVNQHRSPSAIAQLASYIHEQPASDRIIHTDRLRYFYLNSHVKLQGTPFIVGNDSTQLHEVYQQGKVLYSTERIDHWLQMAPVEEQTFFHNPYVNRLWSQVKVYKYAKNG